MTSLLLRKLQCLKLPLFLTKHSAKCNFLVKYEIFGITNTNVQIWTAKYDFNKEQAEAIELQNSAFVSLYQVS